MSRGGGGSLCSVCWDPREQQWLCPARHLYVPQNIEDAVCWHWYCHNANTPCKAWHPPSAASPRLCSSLPISQRGPLGVASLSPLGFFPV